MRVIGLMSGTSLDGVDAALVEFRDEGGGEPSWTVLAWLTTPYDAAMRALLHGAIVNGGAAELCRVNVELGEWFARAALAVCELAGVSPREVDLIGSHGQTVWHQPPSGGRCGATLQLGCAATIAERTGIPVVSDFRSRDMAAGGEGAPLVPWADRLLFSVPGRRRALQNIGGMANVTWLPPRGSSEPILAFDTGPGVVLIDAAVQLATDGRETYDRGGAWAASGTVREDLLAELLADPFVSRNPPKSTGREVFGRPLVESLAGRVGASSRADWADLVATLTELTARSIGDAYRRWVLPRGVDEVILTGGGGRNPALVERIRAQLAPLPVLPGEVLGIDPDAKEAIAFAALAWAHVRGVPGNVPEATGAAGQRVLGSYTPGSPDRIS